MQVDLAALRDVDRHYWLTQGMARTAGVSLCQEIAAGQLSEAEFLEMVARCGSCDRTEHCVRWMAEGAPGAPRIPDYCLNHEKIESLRVRFASGG